MLLYTDLLFLFLILYLILPAAFTKFPEAISKVGGDVEIKELSALSPPCVLPLLLLLLLLPFGG